DSLCWAVTIDRVDALVVSACGDAREAMTIIDRWLADPSPVVFEQGRLELLAATARAAVGERGDAAGICRTAHDRFATLGARVRAEEARSLAERLAPRAPGRPRSAHPLGLTDRELEIIAFVRQGLSDKQMAERLYVSITTIRKHLENVRRKTGRRARSELAAFAREDASIE
ncbi:MAG TPA: LuxR C-terminal-related transcriptional regulator, partial [Actinomycetota bacterium]|nr:LuxR C-terminal-related transcriptional regulator [Actinomycetota bacterium]